MEDGLLEDVMKCFPGSVLVAVTQEGSSDTDPKWDYTVDGWEADAKRIIEHIKKRGFLYKLHNNAFVWSDSKMEIKATGFEITLLFCARNHLAALYRRELGLCEQCGEDNKRGISFYCKGCNTVYGDALNHVTGGYELPARLMHIKRIREKASR